MTNELLTTEFTSEAVSQDDGVFPAEHLRNLSHEDIQAALERYRKTASQKAPAPGSGGIGD